jgi:LacI family transcriptional regulator
MADRQRKATQFDVARGAGVSQATVSLVLGAFPATTIRANTSARVREVARELGYAPNHFAQALRTKKARTIAVVVPDTAIRFSRPF